MTGGPPAVCAFFWGEQCFIPLNTLCPHPLGKSMIWDWLWVLNQSRCPKQPSWTLCFRIHLSELYTVWALCDTNRSQTQLSGSLLTWPWLNFLTLHSLTKSIRAFNVWNRGPLCFHHSGWLSLNKKQGQRHQQFPGQGRCPKAILNEDLVLE